ncbi:non-ribosomal peptide synthetase [Eubacterium oxidoreducens]|uniref:Thioester reductase domain-containing protein n=1 Tax=Eubacterium oxidoreducens TaxID=1732 RepID=A0A1G6AN73_EUBOX|nr:thioester reductase domain-containing protein [Eubacterium oxidoreducens]SDB09866.1 thioester reductase domain-containing protein [Eubacterium oxidoreducens]
MNLSSSNIIKLLEKHAQEDPDLVIYRFVDYRDDEFHFQDCTNRLIFRKSLEMAYELKRKGLKKGDRAVIFSMQDFGTVYAILGCMMAGVVFTIIPPPLDENKVARFISVLKSCRPKALISNYALEQESETKLTARLLKDAFFNVITLKRIYTDKLTPYKNTDVIVSQNPNDLVYLQYTSGSTSAPKGVMIRRHQLMSQMQQCDNVYDFSTSRMATWVPFFHNLGLVITVLMPLCVNGAVIYHINTMQFLSNPKIWIKLMNKYRCNLTVGPGSAFEACTKIFSPQEASKIDLSCATHFMNGSEFVSPQTIAKFSEMFNVPYHAAAPGYGLGECCCLASVAGLDYKVLRVDYESYQKNKIVLSDAPDAKEIVSLGKPVTGLKIIAVNPKTRKTYDELHIGEICLQGPNVASGYWGKIPENKNFHFRLTDQEGDFYRTGDLGFMYEGNLYITGRLKEMFIINGHNVYPGDLLGYLQRHSPSITANACGFFSISDGKKEHIYAVMEFEDTDNYINYASRINSLIAKQFEFSFYDILFVPKNSLPRTDNNKLQMLKTRALYEKKELPILFSYRTSNHSNYTVSSKESDGAHANEDKNDAIFTKVKEMFDRVLKLDSYNVHDSFLELGGDSLMGFELLNKIEEDFGIKMDFRELLADASVYGVTNHIKRVLSGKQPSGKPIDLKMECRLDKSIVPQGSYEKSPQECSKIFLTGSSGFLGSNLIKSFIQQYPHDDLEIYCHVRAESTEKGYNKIKNRMIHFGCWNEEYSKFIRPVLGDLTKPNMGMDQEIYNELSNKIDVVYHNGALLNFVYPYSYLKNTNVYGTIEALRFACAKKPKYFHFISSYSVFDTPDNLGKFVTESQPLNTSSGFSLAYSETKWVAEKLVGIANKRGLKTVIYRPGDITGGKNGIWNLEDMVSRIIVGCIQLGCIPFAIYELHMTPVDYIADAIAHISQKEEAISKNFHLINPVPLPLGKLVSSIRRCGYPLRYTTFKRWKTKLDAAQNTNVLAMLDCLFTQGNESNPGILRHFTGRNTKYSTANTAMLLSDSNITCPIVGTKFISKYLHYFKSSGYLD